jgi:hypothetical protein
VHERVEGRLQAAQFESEGGVMYGVCLVLSRAWDDWHFQQTDEWAIYRRGYTHLRDSPFCAGCAPLVTQYARDWIRVHWDSAADRVALNETVDHNAEAASAQHGEIIA